MSAGTREAVPARAERLSGGLDRPTLVVVGVATLGLIMAVLDTTIVNVALDTLSRDLRASLSTVQWVSTGYLLSVAAVIPLSGWTTERFGSKRTWIASIALFAVGSALCALATSAGELIAFRVLQGFGGGMLVPVGFTLIAQSAGPRQIGRALAVLGVPVLLGPIFGPIIGGLIVDSATWQWIFVVNVPIAVVAMVVAARLLQPDAGRADAGALDWVGAALLCPGLAGVVFGLSETESHGGIGSPLAFGPILAGLALVGLFAWHSLRVTRPLIDLRLFRSAGFRAAATVTFFLGTALFSMLLVLPLYYQVDRGESALHAGLLLAPQGLGAALMLPIAGRLTDRLGGGPVVLAGCSVIALATLPLVLVSGHTSYALIGGVLFVRGMGLGASIQPATAAAYALLHASQVPGATAVLNTLRQIGGSIGTALLAVVLEHESLAVLPQSSSTGGLLAPLPAGARGQVSGPLATAFDDTFMWAFGMALVAILPAIALVRAERALRRPEVVGSGPVPTPTRRILFPIGRAGISERALEVALRIARRRRATLVPAYLAVVPLQLPLDTAISRDRSIATPMLEAIEQKGSRDGVPVDTRVEVGRTYRHALERLYKTERFDRTVADAAEGALTGDIDWLLERAPGEVVVLRPDSHTTPREHLPPAA
jgi:EmrB/QacA subfamily drug resistance transporter